MIQSLTNILGDPTPFSYQIPGYKTGYPSLDDSLGGISTSDLVLLASKTGNWGSNLTWTSQNQTGINCVTLALKS